MNDLISRQVAVNAFMEATADGDKAGFCIDVINALPTVDAIEVVRCRDCKWRDDQKGATKWMPCRALVTPNDFYCASGERKGGEAHD